MKTESTLETDIMIKILHTGDIHLDAPFASLGPERAEYRRNEMRRTFSDIVTFAAENADIMVIAGDLFDSGIVTRATYMFVRREFERFGKPVFITPGNHDPADSDSVWQRCTFGDNVHVFLKAEPECVTVPELNTAVWGYAYTSPYMGDDLHPLRGKKADDSGMINILVCHTADSSDRRNITATEDEIMAFGADYAALGHMHNAPEYNGKRYAWCGCPEPSKFTETGEKGAVLADVEKGSAEVRRIRFAKKTSVCGEIDVTGCESADDVNSSVKRYIVEHEFDENTMLALRLTGTLPPSVIPDISSPETYGLFALKTEDATVPDIDSAELENDITIRGEIYRKIKPRLESADSREREIARCALRYALNAIDNI